MLIVRPARLEDLDSFLELARLAGPGFTSLAVSDNELKERLEKSANSFANPDDGPGDYVFLLMLEDTQTGEVVGVGAIKSQVGIEKPFFNFKILNIIQSSRAAEAMKERRYPARYQRVATTGRLANYCFPRVRCRYFASHWLRPLWLLRCLHS